MMTRGLYLLFVLAISALIVAPAFAKPASVNGRWLTEERDAIVRISQCGRTVCGRIQEILVPTPEADQRDTNNPNPNLRSRRILGLPVLTGFTPDETKWRGRIYDPKSGKDYRSILTLLKNGKLKVQGCIGPFCQTQYWTRAR